MTNNTTEEEEFYPGFPTRWLLALSVALTCLFVFIDYQLYGLGKILAIQLISHGLTALACGWLTNRLKLWRNWRDILFFVVMGCPLHKFIDTAIDGLMHREFLQTLKFALRWWLDYPFSLSHWLPDRATLGTLLAGIFLLPAGSADDWREDDYPGLSNGSSLLQAIAALIGMLPMVVFFFIFPPVGGNWLVSIIGLPVAGAGVVATSYLHWLVKRFRFYRRPGDFVLFTLLGLSVGALIEVLILIVGTIAIVLLFRIPPSSFIHAIQIALLYGNLPGLALELLLFCWRLPRAPER